MLHCPLLSVNNRRLVGVLQADGVDESSTDTSLLSDGVRPLVADVRAGLQRMIQVFITHSAHVFLVDCTPVGREVIGDQLLRLEDQVQHCVSWYKAVMKLT